jgi:3-oxoacyl-[acyl-carrier protein] reductase
LDLGLNGRRALVCASSAGLGLGCATALAAEGVDVVMNGRDALRLDRAAQALRERYEVDIATVVADVATEEGRAALLGACPRPDILVTNAGGPPLGDFREWDRDDWVEALDRLMIAPILLMRGVVDHMVAQRFGRVVNVSSVAVRMPALDRGLTNGAKGGLTGFVSGLARQLAEHGVTINNILPGLCATDRGREAIRQRAERRGEPAEAYEKTMLADIPARRMGDPQEFGRLCAFLCSAHTGYITRQNILFDGGWYPGIA